MAIATATSATPRLREREDLGRADKRCLYNGRMSVLQDDRRPAVLKELVLESLRLG